METRQCGGVAVGTGTSLYKQRALYRGWGDIGGGLWHELRLVDATNEVRKTKGKHSFFRW